MELVQSNEVSSSYHMEVEGLQRCVQTLEREGLKIDALITDRHLGVGKWVKENMKSIYHRFDVWHVAKSFRKKVDALGKLKGCETLRKWTKSIVNHIYWCAASTPDGSSDVMRSKWLSLDNHLHNIHEGHDHLFPKCLHSTLPEARNKEWIMPHTPASVKLTKLIKAKKFCRDMGKLSPYHQTSSLESFHSLLIHFIPKSTAFGYHGMKVRQYLAALHYNENAKCVQALTTDGKERYVVKYPKYKKGDFIVRKIRI
eukprot:m.252094 g.252094  ORF g.252094 m.252094 type:complete len:256 (+) comp40347_c0_seq9:790-1557(+)